MQPTSAAPPRARPAADAALPIDDPRAGILLLDAVLAFAIVGLLLTVAWPYLPRGTSAARHAGYALEIAAVLKNDRTAAARQEREVATLIDVRRRAIASGSGGRQIVLPRDLLLDVLATDLCAAGDQRFKVAFAPDGRACGTVIRIAKGERAWKVRVNWLTGLVDVLAPGQG